ncbi:MAG: phage minor head protein [Cetobacterium sp.]|uniref:phage minor head protein n=1 Tax=Cetobacterium sp. TaxID=2071632 RepID=UPI003EE59039
MSKIKKKNIKTANLIRKQNQIQAKKLQVKLKKDFLSLLDEIKENGEFNFDFDGFKKKAADSLILNFREFSKLKSDSNFKMWKLNAKDFPIPSIVKKLENKYRKNIGKKTTKITERYKGSISKIIAEGKEKGLSFKEVADKLRSTIIGISEKRSHVIAVTETYTVSDQIDYDMAEEVGMKNKTWVHAGGGKTDRPTHLALDGTMIGMDEYFNVGGVMALHPHDSNLGAEDVVNCHCVAIYE